MDHIAREDAYRYKPRKTSRDTLDRTGFDSNWWFCLINVVENVPRDMKTSDTLRVPRSTSTRTRAHPDTFRSVVRIVIVLELYYKNSNVEWLSQRKVARLLCSNLEHECSSSRLFHFSSSFDNKLNLTCWYEAQCVNFWCWQSQIKCVINNTSNRDGKNSCCNWQFASI